MNKDELREKRNQTIENLNDIKAILGLDELYIDELEKERDKYKGCYERCIMQMSEATEIIKFLINPQLLDKPQYYKWRLKAEKFIEEN